jgi:ABC-type glycerol-3-phosphate transport system substrate-binding protein
VGTVTRDGRVYGLPLTTSTQLLFYNRERVPVPPSTVDELTRLVSQPDINLGLNTQFLLAFWGIRLFGGRPYDAAGGFNLDRGALVNWLTMLKNVQSAAGFMLSDDQDLLRQSFIDGDLELYIGSARENVELQAALGDRLGAVRLPVSATGNPSGPILQADVLLVSQNADEEEAKRALQLAEFLTNPQQQAAFTQTPLGRLPANNAVRISPSMPEIVVELAKQVRSAVPITLDQRELWLTVAEESQTLYRGVLEGVVDVYAGAEAVENILREQQGRTTGDGLTPAIACPQLASSAPITLTLWHGWTVPETAVLQELEDEFTSLCPEVRILSSQVPDNWELNERYRTAAAAGEGPDVLLDSTQFVATLAQDGLIRPLNDVVDPTRLSQFVPTSVQSLRYNGQLYGLPEAARSIALFYNPQLVSQPPQSLDDLLLAVDLDHQFVMPLTFFYAFWGLGAFGGRMFDENRVAILDQGGMAEWLQWLHDAANRPGFVFTDGRTDAEDQFIARKAAFLVTGPWSLPKLYNAMPRDEIAVAMLPAGPVNVASPILEVEAFMFRPDIDADKLQAALAFANFVTNGANQQRLLATGVHVPANVTVDASADPIISGFRDQTQTAFPAIQDNNWAVVFEHGDQLYQDTVLGERPPQEAVEEFTQMVNETNGK